MTIGIILLFCIVVAFIGWLFYFAFWVGTAALVIILICTFAAWNEMPATKPIASKSTSISLSSNFEHYYNLANVSNDNKDYVSAYRQYNMALREATNKRDSLKSLAALIIVSKSLNNMEKCHEHSSQLRKLSYKNKFLNVCD